MSLLIFALIVILVLALALYAIDLIPLGDTRIKRIVQALAVVIAALVILSRAGLAAGI